LGAVEHREGEGHTTRGGGPLILAAILIGLNFVAIKVAVETIPPLLVGALRFTLGGAVLLSFVRWMGLGSRPTRRLLLTTLGIGLIGALSTTSPSTRARA
jgi:drug/metabolite transporter (DMT)-like permease